MAVKVPNKYFNRTIQSPRTKLGSSHETRQPLRKNPAILRKTHQLFRTKPTTPEKTHQLFRTRTTTPHETSGPTARNSLIVSHTHLVAHREVMDSICTGISKVDSSYYKLG